MQNPNRAQIDEDCTGGYGRPLCVQQVADTIKILEEESEEDLLKAEKYILRVMNQRNSKHVSRLAKCIQFALTKE
jgi:hypothetical protein